VISQTPEPQPGTYVLLCYAGQPGFVTAGRFGRLPIRKGYYLYAGSALGPGGLRARLAHHGRPASKPHWHIDYLRAAAPLREVWFCYGPERREHLWAGVLREVLGGTVPFPGFGSSDCGCKSHLFFFEKHPAHSAFEAAVHESGAVLYTFEPA
jgi:Uri superfamily endonuclease